MFSWGKVLQFDQELTHVNMNFPLLDKTIWNKEINATEVNKVPRRLISFQIHVLRDKQVEYFSNKENSSKRLNININLDLMDLASVERLKLVTNETRFSEQINNSGIFSGFIFLKVFLLMMSIYKKTIQDDIIIDVDDLLCAENYQVICIYSRIVVILDYINSFNTKQLDLVDLPFFDILQTFFFEEFLI